MRVKFVLITNPNNPLGVIYGPDIVRDVVKWARKRSLHTIMDELYALSTHEKDEPEGSNLSFGFWTTSWVTTFVFCGLCPRIWGPVAFRVGTLYTQNAAAAGSISQLEHLFRSEPPHSNDHSRNLDR
jgi:1-aminocyclopropane-1-carboxylate synthase